MTIIKNVSNETIYKFIVTFEEQKNNAIYRENESHGAGCITL